ncbi:MAG: hypothetical protein NNA18_01375 [Nitrospira sp.]|nr:hypothetical protein [Nitrospira sp.]
MTTSSQGLVSPQRVKLELLHGAGWLFHHVPPLENEGRARYPTVGKRPSMWSKALNESS